MTQELEEMVDTSETIYNQPQLTMLSDNAADISKALRVLGKFRWFGCAAHCLNLTAQAAFKKVPVAAKLVKRMKKTSQICKKEYTSI